MAGVLVQCLRVGREEGRAIRSVAPALDTLVPCSRTALVSEGFPGSQPGRERATSLLEVLSAVRALTVMSNQSDR